MNGRTSIQIDRIHLLMGILEEELMEYKNKSKAYEEWSNADQRDYNNWPGIARGARVKRLMLVLRQETIKLDKML